MWKNYYATISIWSPTNSGVKISVSLKGFRICNNICTPFWGLAPTDLFVTKKPKIWKFSVRVNFENSAEILCYFLKTSQFGRSPEIREPATALFWTTIWRKFVLADKVFCKHLDLVISQLLDKIFQPFKEQKWCPSRPMRGSRILFYRVFFNTRFWN